MKKLSLLTTALLCCSLAFAQEAEEGGTVLKFIPRLDVNPYIPASENGYSGFDLSNTSLYTLFEGGIGNSDFSYSVEGHWLSTDPASLYANTWHADECNWLDWAYVSYAPGAFEFTLGKQPLAIGTFELDEYDFNSHIGLSSTVWNNLNIYHWAAKAAWTLPSENATIAAQIASSPFGCKPFENGLMTYSLYGTVETDSYSGIYSANLMGYDKGAFVKTVALGNQFYFGDFTATVDYIIRGYESPLEEQTFLFSLGWEPFENFNITGKFGVEEAVDSKGDEVFGWNPVLDLEDPADYYVPASLPLFRAKSEMMSMTAPYMFAGVAAHYTLFDDLRLHAVVAGNNWSKSLSVNFGLTYFFDLAKFIR